MEFGAVDEQPGADGKQVKRVAVLPRTDQIFELQTIIRDKYNSFLGTAVDDHHVRAGQRITATLCSTRIA
jgi:hypothetical protein